MSKEKREMVRVRNDFSRIPTILEIPDLIEIQKRSYDTFLQRELASDKRIEALSRGASFARLLDIQRSAIQTIKMNLMETGLAESAEVLFQDAFHLIHGKSDRSFEYIYIAPPQYKGTWEKALVALDANILWLAQDGWVIAQVHPKEYKVLPLSNLEEFDQRNYGSTLLIFYRRP